VWGTGRPRREFLYSDDLADACIHLLNLPESTYGSLLRDDQPPLVNIGTGKDLTIRELAELVLDVIECDCELEFDTSRQDGTPQKLLDVSRINALDWKAKVALKDGIRRTFEAVRSDLELVQR
jgi:GDP-L-fucose synthase